MLRTAVQLSYSLLHLHRWRAFVVFRQVNVPPSKPHQLTEPKLTECRNEYEHAIPPLDLRGNREYLRQRCGRPFSSRNLASSPDPAGITPDQFIVGGGVARSIGRLAKLTT